MFIPFLSNFFRGTRRMQYVSTLIASLAVTTTQSHLTWPSPTLPLLTGDDSPIGEKVAGGQSSWIVASVLLAGIPMGATYNITMARFGRKQIIHAGSVTLFLSWFLIMFADDVAYIYAGRVLAGILNSVTVITTAMYCSEIADVDIRGRLGTIYGIMKIVGSILVLSVVLVFTRIVSSLSVGPFVSYVVLAIILAIVPFSLFCLLFFIPESPHSLIKMNRMEEAREAVKALSGLTDDKEIDKRVDVIVHFVNSAEKPMKLMAVLKEKKYIKAIACLITVVVMEYSSGYNAISAYQQQIIENSESAISPEISSIMFGLIQIPASVVSAFLVDRLGRKIILYIGCTGCMIPLIVEGVYFYLEDYVKSDVSAISWIPTTGIVVFLIMHSVHAAVPYILLGEFFAHKIKNVGTMLYVTFGTGSMFLVQYTYEPIKEAAGLYTVFWIYAFFQLATIVSTYFLLVETKNKSFAEIEKEVYK